MGNDGVAIDPGVPAQGGAPGGRRRPTCGVILALLVATAVSGCAGAHLYDQENDTTAAAAKAASDDLNLVGVIDQERQNLGKLLSNDLAATAAFARTRRDRELQALLVDRKVPGKDGTESLSAKLGRLISARTRALGGDVPTIDALKAINNIRPAYEASRNARDNFLSVLKIPAPNCDPRETPTVTDSTVIDDYLARARKVLPEGRKLDAGNVEAELRNAETACSQYRAAWETISNLPNEIGRRANAWLDARQDLDDAKTAANDKKADYDAALAEYRKTRKAADANPSDAAKRAVEERINQVGDALEALHGAGVFGRSASARERVERIDLILAAAATGPLDATTLKDADEETRAAVGVSGLLPSVVGRLSAIAALAEAPPINALIFEKDRLLALKLGADRAVERATARVALRRQQLDLAVAELDTLEQASRHRDRAVAANKNQPVTVEGLIGGQVDARVRRLMVAAIATYLGTFTGPRRADREIEYRLIDVDHAEALDSSETALRLWQTALQQPVASLAAYHGSGVRREDIIEIMKGLGLFAIAGRVN